MYLKLGKTTIKYNSDIDDFMIISEVIDSSTSLDRPTIVRSVDELDIWFGKNFTSRSYFDELLKYGVSLYLYKPISVEDNLYSSNYIDYSNYSESENIYVSIDNIIDPVDNIIYRIYDDNGEFVEILNNTKLKYSKYLYIDGNFINLNDLPQNIDTNDSMSFNNRDTLRICYKNYIGPSYTNPKYFSNSDESYNYNIDEDILISNLPNLSKIPLGYETLSLDFYFNYDEINFNIPNQYIIINSLNERVMIWFKYNSSNIPNISPNFYDREEYIEVDNLEKDQVINLLMNKFSELGYNIRTKDSFNYNIYSSFNIKNPYFYNIDGLTVNSNYRVTQDILSMISKNKSRITFISKTIGKSEKDGKIGIEIKKIGTDFYRIIISRFNYTEYFEGSLFGKDRIDINITNNSKLVECNLSMNYINDLGDNILYELSDINSELIEGYWELDGAEEEIYTKEMYWKSINSLLFENDVKVDYFLVPNIYNYVDTIDKDYNYFLEYKEFLSLSENSGCQFLIQNTDSKWKIVDVDTLPLNPKEWEVYNYMGNFYILSDGELIETTDRLIINYEGNDFVFNYTEDKNNILVYFYRPITVNNELRPGYYLFLNSLLSDNYMSSEKNIIYESPSKNAYTINELEEKLIKYKSNYLVNNNHSVYYKNYQNGESYNTTIWMRFCLGKIRRELEKNKWLFLSKRFVGDIEKNITKVLERIYKTFSIIRNITISNFNIDYRNNKISLSISTEMSDLINNDIELDITLNYND